jgi:hypothetical protein
MASNPKSSVTPSTSNAHLEEAALDVLTSGAFSASTSGDRSARIREWLATDPDGTLVQEVFREMSSKDKGAAKPLRERLDELKRQKLQESIAHEWAQKAQALLGQDKLNIADAMAWQRDAAKAGAGLSREPLATLKQQLAARVSDIEDLQHGCQVQREAAVLLAQRTEVLSTKPFADAKAAREGLQKDFDNWQHQADALTQNANWVSVDAKFPPSLNASGQQLHAVWQAFTDALAQTDAAINDASAPLPNVPVWADEIRTLRGGAEVVAKPGKAKPDPALKTAAVAQVQEALQHLETELALGHGKATALAAGALRNALKEHASYLDAKLEGQVHMALAAAGELEGWQRWRADQLRQELVVKAQGLLARPAGQTLGGKKIQEQLRSLREQWKATDQGGHPNHALWKKFDEACNEAHKVVDHWIEKVKADNALHKDQRLALVAEMKAWAQEHAKGPDWKAVNRSLGQFVQRWQDAGHVNEKTYADLAPLWKEALDAASADLRAVQETSIELRRQMTTEADALGAATSLNVAAVKALQQRWQAEAQRVPLDRKFEQKLWDRFRKPVDDAFARKSTEREKSAQLMGEHDKRVAQAAKVLQEVSHQGDAAAIAKAMSDLKAAISGQQAALNAQTPQTPAETAPLPTSESAEPTPSETPADESAVPPESAEQVEPASAVKAAPKPVIAMRGDDRPGAKRPDAVPTLGGRDGKPWANKGGRNDSRGPAGREDRWSNRPEREESRGPRLGDAAFRAQRAAFEAAESAMKKLAAQAHGEVLTQLMGAWQERQAEQVPAAQALGGRVAAGVRQAWSKSLQSLPAPSQAADSALLRLEMASESPTPAAYLDARRSLQLQLLTRRNDPAPRETWGADVATVFASTYSEDSAKRLQAVLKLLLRNRS